VTPEHLPPHGHFSPKTTIAVTYPLVRVSVSVTVRGIIRVRVWLMSNVVGLLFGVAFRSLKTEYRAYSVRVGLKLGTLASPDNKYRRHLPLG